MNFSPGKVGSVRTATVPFQELDHFGRWRVEVFTDRVDPQRGGKWERVPLSELAVESSEAILPSEYATEQVLYVGLENVESVTGEPVDLRPREKEEIKSRSKLFRDGYVLYGRLRPYLRKVLLATPPYHEGICSTEFIVLIPNVERILPELLRAVLASEVISKDLARFQIGAALPRISPKDFFSLRIPLPPMKVQREYLARLKETSVAIRRAKKQLRELPLRIDAAVLELLAD